MFILQVSVTFSGNHFLQIKGVSLACGNISLMMREKHLALLTIHIDTPKYVLMTTFS